jgi:hypothetical protein
MAITEIKLSGKVYTDAGTAVSGATVALLETGTSSEETSTTTNSSGEWSFAETDLNTTYDIKITVGSSVRYILWSDEITTTGLDTASLKVRGVASAAAPIYLFADRADDPGDAWRIQASTSDTLAIGSDKASAGTIIDYLTITNGANAAASTVTVGGILTVTTTLDVNGTADFDVTDFDIASSGDIDLVSTNDAAAAIYLRENAGTSGTIKIHADQGTSVTEGAESINILSDAGGVGIRSTANLANAVNLTVDGGTTSTMTLFNDQGTAATEGAASIQLLSDVGGVNIKSGLNGANAILLTADGGTSETIVIHADQGSGTGSIELLSDAGGIKLTAASDVIIPSGVGLILDGSGSEKIESDGTDISISVGSNGDINVPANIGVTFGDDGEKIEGDGTDLTIAGNNINLTATADVVIPADVGITFGTGEKIEGDSTDLTVTSGAKINLTATSDVVIPSGVGLVLDGSGNEKVESDGTDISISVGSGGDINIPADIGVTFGNDGEKIEGDGTDLTISGNNINLTATADVVIPSGVGLILDGSGSEKIESDGTDISFSVGANGDINIPGDIGLTFGDDGEKIEGDGTDLTISGNTINLNGAVDMGNNTLTGGTGDLNWDSGTLFVDSSADKVAINRTSSLLAALDVIRTGSSVQIAIAPGNLTSAADGVGASIHYQGNTAGQSMVDLAGVWEADATSTSFKVETRNAGTMQQNLVIKGDGEVDFKSRAPGLSNIGAAGNDFGASTLDLAAGYTISGAGELTVEAASGNLNLGNTGNMKFLRGASTMALIGASGIRLASDTAHGTTAGTNLISIFNGTAPAGTLANGASFFCASGQMKVIQADGVATDVSPHNPETGEWWFNSKDVHGRVFRVHVERLMRRLDEEYGGGFIEEFTEEIGA